uniref:Uncharacterized protein n=1 Tax=Cucumis sativus TaxID=3659 RepID=A0A0A0L7G5_CUCSA
MAAYTQVHAVDEIYIIHISYMNVKQNKAAELCSLLLPLTPSTSTAAYKRSGFS